MKKYAALLGSLLLMFVGSAQAGLYNFTGNMKYHNDVIYTYFTVANDATNVRVWTDSFKEFTNFDPITALWTANGMLIAQNDDNPSVDPLTQTYFDSGFLLPNLAAGQYIFTMTTFPNFAQSSLLADGFNFDAQAAIPFKDWLATTYSNSGFNNIGSFWSVWVDGVDQASNPSVPAPAPILLFGFGLLALALRKFKA
jgi:hypothetical protein